MIYLMFLGFSSVGLLPFIIYADAAAEGLFWSLACDTSETVTRAVGANFSVQIVSPCRNDAIGCRIRYLFYENTKDIYLRQPKEIAINRSGGTVTATEQYREQGATTYYSYKNTSDNNAVIFQLEMVPENRRVAMIFRAKSSFQHCFFFQFATVTFTGCTNHTGFDVVLRNSATDIARYLDVGEIICKRDGDGRAIFKNGSEVLSTSTYCEADASWKGADDISCIYPIPASIKIIGHPYNEAIMMEYKNNSREDRISLKCSSNGTDKTTNAIFLINNQEQNSGSPIVVSPAINGQSVSCYFISNYTERFPADVDAYMSTATVIVKFGPHPAPGHDTLCATKNGSVEFYSNPPSSEKSLALVFKGERDEEIPSSIAPCSYQHYGVQGQVITPISNLGIFDNLYLRYYASRKYLYYPVIVCQETSATTASYDSTASTNNERSSTLTSLLLILSLVTALLFIALIACLLWSRHLKGALHEKITD